jgi:hypothetical protein
MTARFLFRFDLLRKTGGHRPPLQPDAASLSSGAFLFKELLGCVYVDRYQQDSVECSSWLA